MLEHHGESAKQYSKNIHRKTAGKQQNIVTKNIIMAYDLDV